MRHEVVSKFYSDLQTLQEKFLEIASPRNHTGIPEVLTVDVEPALKSMKMGIQTEK